jgi:hypothetical protein
VHCWLHALQLVQVTSDRWVEHTCALCRCVTLCTVNVFGGGRTLQVTSRNMPLGPGAAAGRLMQ